MTRFTLFDTAIGWAGLAWADHGLVGAYLPERDLEVVRRGFLRKFPGAEVASAPPELQPVVEAIQAMLRGEAADLSDAPLDWGRTPAFNRRVYEIAQAIPAGQTLTYGEVAVRLGDKLLARDVGAALGQNPWPMIVPCHRVRAADGKLGGFSARGGAQTKLKLLAIEGAAAAAQGDLFG